MNIIRLTSEHPKKMFLNVAKLHASHIHHGILPKLGMRFLARLYFELSRTHKAGIWVATDGMQIAGFIAGCADVRKGYLSVLMSPVLYFWLVFGGGLFRQVGPSRLISVFTYLFRRERKPEQTAHERQATSSVRAELLAIALDPHYRGQGIGKQLVRELETNMTSWGVDQGYRVSTNAADTASNSFYRALGFTLCGAVRHHDLTLNVYEKKFQISSSHL